MKSKKVVGLLILFLVVGFAAVSTVLYINGNVSISISNDFDVYFSNALTDIDSLSEISSDGKKITFNSGVLKSVEDTSYLEYTIKNNSSQYDADVKINCTGVPDELKSYVSFVNTKND